MGEIVSAIFGFFLMFLQVIVQIVLPVMAMIFTSIGALVRAGLLVFATLTAITVGLILHILFAIVLTILAKSYGVRSRWMAWFPILNAHLLGEVADARRARDGKKPRRLGLWMTVAATALLAIPGTLTMVAAFVYTVSYLVYTALTNFGALVLIGIFVLFFIACLTVMLSPEIGMILSMLAFFAMFAAIFATAAFMDFLGLLLTLVQWLLPLGVLLGGLISALIFFVIYLVTVGSLMTTGKRVVFVILSVIFPLLSPIFLVIFRERIPA